METPKPNPSAPPPLPQNKSAQPTPAAPQQKEKLNPAIWVLFATGALMVDLGQIGLEALLIGVVLNLIIDVLVGLSLGTFFAVKGMLNWRTAFSIFLGFAVDFFTDGIAPAWIIDIGLVWLQTDGSRAFAKVPFAGAQLQQMATLALRGKSGGAGAGAGAKPSPLPSSTKEGVKPPPLPTTQSVNGIKTGNSNFENQPSPKEPSSVTDRADKLKAHADEYREGIKEKTNQYGSGVRRGQDFIRGGQKQIRPTNQPVNFGGNLWREHGELQRQANKERNIENISKQFGISREEAERRVGKDWSNN